jgi:hypothetical protein
VDVDSGRERPDALWLLGTAQYGVCLFGGGALWFVLARLTRGFGGAPGAQAAACLALLALIGAEAWWARLPNPRNAAADYLISFLSSAAIAAFGMAVVLAVALVLAR